ncbi:MAG: sigma-70 family RNA polymerase sigma factor [Lachnospiraceae bacterium]|nr:sigma-70 family RNA polymerase sigma factor [Lachnospiraceae bacterium]
MEQKLVKEQRWNDLAQEYQTMLYRIAFSNMKNRADAEDVVQETFLRYMKDEKPIQNKEHEKAWLIRTAINICIDILKSSWYRKTTAWNEMLPIAAQNIYLPYQIKDDKMLEAVLALPVHYRNPIYLFYYEDYSIHEIAGILNEKEATIKTRLRRGREEVKKILTEGRP